MDALYLSTTIVVDLSAKVVIGLQEVNLQEFLVVVC
jgi:hypothetical protein